MSLISKVDEVEELDNHERVRCLRRCATRIELLEDHVDADLDAPQLRLRQARDIPTVDEHRAGRHGLERVD